MAFMNASYAPFSGFVSGWAQYILAFAKGSDEQNAKNDIDKALDELSKFSDHELYDIGLSRADLSPEGLAAAGERRSHQQAMIDAEMSELFFVPKS